MEKTKAKKPYKKSKVKAEKKYIEDDVIITYYSKSTDVKIAGLFNRWEPEEMIKDKDDFWTYSKRLKNGTYKFNFIVDGEWCHDDKYPIDERDEFHFSDDSDNEGDGFVNKCNKIRVNGHMCFSCNTLPISILVGEDGKICGHCGCNICNDDDISKNSDDECPDCGNYTLTPIKIGKQKALACVLCDLIS